MRIKFTLLYPNFKRKAVTFSYDDGTLHDRKLVKIFNDNGYRGTFNLNTGKSKEIKFRGEVDCSYIDIPNEIGMYKG